jgi:hypothetical protein
VVNIASTRLLKRKKQGRMGCLNSKTAEDVRQTAMDKKISKDQHASMQRQEEMIKLLLLGAGESGKSTIFKQMKILYGHSWATDELLALKPVVFANIIQNMRLVLEYADVNGFDFGDEASLAKTFISLPDDADVSGENGKMVKKLWANPAVKEAWGKRSGFQVLDCLQYYADEIDRISAAGYIPTQQDVLQARVRTSGIVEEKYVIDGVPFVMFGKFVMERIFLSRSEETNTNYTPCTTSRCWRPT